MKTGKPAWLPYGIGGGAILAIAILFGIGALVRNALTPDYPTLTSLPSLETPATVDLTYIATSSPTDTALPEIQTTATLIYLQTASTIFTFEPANTPSATPSVGSTMVSEKDGMVMVYVPAGEFQMGSENGENDEKPVHSVYLDAFWIDQTEVTNAMYAKCVEAGECNPPSYVTHYNDSSYANHPVVYVSWNDANDYCAWSGRRLPSEAEWEKAAGWDEVAQAHRIYPWGNTIDESYANYNGKIGDTTVVGSYEKGASFYGATDMAGNAWEWVSSLYQSYPYSATDGREDLSASGNRVLRGGSWDYIDSSVRSANRDWNDSSSAGASIGFRCARDSSP